MKLYIANLYDNLLVLSSSEIIRSATNENDSQELLWDSFCELTYIIRINFRPIDTDADDKMVEDVVSIAKECNGKALYSTKYKHIIVPAFTNEHDILKFKQIMEAKILLCSMKEDE